MPKKKNNQAANKPAENVAAEPKKKRGRPAPKAQDKPIDPPKPEKKSSERKTHVRKPKSQKNNAPRKNEKSVKVIALGGLGEIGKNMTLLEFEDDIIIIDCGIGFPEEDMPGVDLVIPNFSYLEENRTKIKGVLLTHGH